MKYKMKEKEKKKKMKDFQALKRGHIQQAITFAVPSSEMRTFLAAKSR